MFKNNARVCDVCDQEIPRGQRYRKLNLTPQAVAMLTSSDDPEMIVPMTQNPDGTITMDICAMCILNVGDIAKCATDHVN